MPGCESARGRHRLAAQPGPQPVVVRVLRRERLDGDGTPEAGVEAAVDDAHAAPPEETGHLVRPQALADQRIVLVAREQLRIGLHRRPVDDARLVVRAEKLQHLVAKRVVPPASRSEEGAPVAPIAR